MQARCSECIRSAITFTNTLPVGTYKVLIPRPLLTNASLWSKIQVGHGYLIVSPKIHSRVSLPLIFINSTYNRLQIKKNNRILLINQLHALSLRSKSNLNTECCQQCYYYIHTLITSTQYRFFSNLSSLHLTTKRNNVGLTQHFFRYSAEFTNLSIELQYSSINKAYEAIVSIFFLLSNLFAPPLL